MLRLNLLLLLIFTMSNAFGANKLQVFVSVLPQKFFVEQVAGELVDVEALVTPGQSPATYNPTPKQIQKLAAAAVFFRTGVPYENAWLPRIKAANPDLKIIDARTVTPLLVMSEHDHDDAHDDEHAHDEHDAHQDEPAESPDPHLWTNPINVIAQAKQIRDFLIAYLPKHQAQLSANTSLFIEQLQNLDQQINKQLAPLTNRRFMVFHPSWAYFADRYDLHQVSVEREGKEPGARSLAHLIDQAQRENIKVIFIQPQFSQKAAQTIARAINGQVEVIDPLAEDYLQNLAKVADLLARQLQ